MPERRNIAISEVFTTKQLAAAIEIFRSDRNHFHARALAEIVEPNMEFINRVTKQENDAGYWTYALEYALIAASPGGTNVR
jgi:hypothetical protein